MAVDWFPDWSGQICAIVASGESAPAEIERLRGRCRVLVVNNSFQLVPWADALYAADRQWWVEYFQAARSFAGLKITGRDTVAKRLGVYLVEVRSETDAAAHQLHLQPRGIIGHGGNSGFQALNVVLQFGARRVLLLGFDYCGGHWHGKHLAPLRDPRPQAMDKWRERLDAQAPRLAAWGVEIINASAISALTAYPKMPVDQALQKFGM